MHGIKKVKFLADKLDKFPLKKKKKKKAIVNFHWDRDMTGKSIMANAKAKAYIRKINLRKLETT